MPSYQGHALRSGPARRAPRRFSGRLLRLVLALALATVIARVPWQAARRQVAALGAIEVKGVRYLDPRAVQAIAGIELGDDLFAIDCARARQALLLHPRIASATVERRWPRVLRVSLVERVPVMLVQHGVPWEIDSAGVLLAPLAQGVVSDVPLLAGISFEKLPEGARVSAVPVQRGLSWIRALSASELQLTAQVSEVDVSDHESTGLLLLDGTQVVAAAWPPGTRELSALRVVLADLKQRGTLAREVDLRYEGQVIVRPAPVEETAAASDSTRTRGQEVGGAGAVGQSPRAGAPAAGA
jgi:cell division protein FtsQ